MLVISTPAPRRARSGHPPLQATMVSELLLVWLKFLRGSRRKHGSGGVPESVDLRGKNYRMELMFVWAGVTFLRI